MEEIREDVCREVSGKSQCSPVRGRGLRNTGPMLGLRIRLRSRRSRSGVEAEWVEEGEPS